MLSDILIPLLVIIFLIKHHSWPKNHDLNRLLTTLGIFIFIALISLLISLTTLSISEVLNGSLYLVRLISYLALLPISYQLFPTTGAKKSLLNWLLLISFLIALTGFIQLIYLPDLEVLAKTQGYDPHINRLVGSWLDPNFIGGFLAFIISLFAGIIIYENGTKKRWLTFFILIVLGLALFLTYSRSAYLALAVSIFIIGLIKSRRLLIAIIILATLGISASERAQQRVNELVTSVYSVLFNTAENPDPTARLRIENWNQTLQLISEKPLLGHGYNNLAAVKLQQGFIIDEAGHSASGSDSSFLTITATTGFLGLIFFVYSYFLIIRQSIKSWLKGSSNLQKGLGFGLFASALGLIVHANFVNSLLFPQIMIFFWPLIGLLYSDQETESSSKTPV